MKRGVVSMALLLAILSSCGLGAVDSSFMFGIWSYDVPWDTAQRAQFFCMLHDTLHFNTIHGHCPDNHLLQICQSETLSVISMNQTWDYHRYGDDTTTIWTWVYGQSAYSAWQSEGDDIGPCDLVYRGGSHVDLGGDNCRYFAHVGSRVDSLIQTGPANNSCSYKQSSYYLLEYLARNIEDKRYHYTASLRYKLGPTVAGNYNDTVAVFYLYRDGAPDESYPGNNDTLVSQIPVYILNSPDTATTLAWSAGLNYSYVVDPVWGGAKYIGGINYRVRWFGNRDIYIDQVKISDVYGRELWEQPSVAAQRLADYTSVAFASSPVIKGWYIVDDNSLLENRDNVLSLRRTDSLLATLTGRPGFITPYTDTSYHSIAAFSHISYQSYPIQKAYSSSSDVPGDTSLQYAWDDYHIDTLEKMAALARRKGTQHYATLQGFEGSGGYRRPTAGEHLCMVNLALAYSVSGILYWTYAGSDGSLDTHNDGFVDSGGATGNRTSTWHEVDTLIGPYIEKMGPIYAGLDWQFAWKWGDTPGSGNEIDSIRCNEYSGANLYLQVGHFHKQGEDAEYYSLVNRRCLASETITGRVYFHNVSGNGANVRRYIVQDLVSGDSLEVFQSFGVSSFAYSIPPGAAGLYKITALYKCSFDGAYVYGGLEDDVASSIANAPDDWVVVGGYRTFPGTGGVDGFMMDLDPNLVSNASYQYGGQNHQIINRTAFFGNRPNDEYSMAGLTIDQATGDSAAFFYFLRKGDPNSTGFFHTDYDAEPDWFTDLARGRNGYLYVGTRYFVMLPDCWSNLLVYSRNWDTWPPTGHEYEGAYNGGNRTNLLDAAVDSSRDNGYFIAATEKYTCNSSQSSDIRLFKVTSRGETVLFSKADSTVTWESAKDIVTTSDGGFIVVGSISDMETSQRDAYVIKYDSNGVRQWSLRKGGSADDEALGIGSALDGNYVVAGYTRSFSALGKDMYVIKITGAGAVLWDTTFGACGDEEARSIVRRGYHSDYDYVLAGYTDSFGNGKKDFCVVKFPELACRWQHGDANGDGAVDISDAVYLIAYIFSGGSAPSPLLSGDANCDRSVDISDVVFLIAHIFSGGSAPCPGCD
jgi:hypothetical protein